MTRTRNEGGRYSTGSDWYKDIEAATLARIDEEWALAGQQCLTEAEQRALDERDEHYPECDGTLIPWERAA
jgi:hypothetical protein